MITDLTSVSEPDIRALIARLQAEPDRLVALQCLSDMFCGVPRDVLEALNDLYAAAPHLSLRLYSASNHTAPVDLANLRALPNVRHLKLHYGVPGIVDVAPLAALSGLLSAELEVLAAYPLGDVLEGWPALQNLSLIREGRASKAVDVSGIAGLPDLATLYVMGYSKGIAAVSNCDTLSTLKLQSLSLPAWDVLPPQRLKLLSLNAVKGPEPVPFRDLHHRAERVTLVRMDKTLPFDGKRAMSKVAADGWFTIDIDYLNGFLEEEWSGHDWAEALERTCEPPDGTRFDPEAGSLSVVGDRRNLVRFQQRLIVAIAAVVDC